MITNNVTRLLQSKKIKFQAFELPVEKLGAEETAEYLNVPVNLIYKSIVLKREKPGSKPILAVIPGDELVDLKRVASALGEKKVHLTTEREAEQLTGLQVGGISPLALINKGFTVLLDESAKRHVEIYVSGGQRGLNIRLPVAALIEVTRARIAEITQPHT